MCCYTISVVTGFLIKRKHFYRLHNCYPYSSNLSAYNSYKSLSNGWCSSGQYGPIPDYDDFSAYDQSKLKCPDGYMRVKPLESYNYEDKSWCKKPRY